MSTNQHNKKKASKQVRIDEALHHALKIFAAREGKSMSQIINGLIEKLLSNEHLG